MNTALPSGDEKMRTVRHMFDEIAPSYERVNRVLTFGLDARWRVATLRRMQLPIGSRVLDLACGTGDFCRLLTTAGHRPIGVDLSMGMLQNARTESPLVQADVLHLPFADDSVDGVTCGFGLRNFVELPGFFDEVARVVRPGGRVAFLDAYNPSFPPLRWGHTLYFGKMVPRIGALLSGNRHAYEYLPKSVSYMPPPAEVVEQIQSAGFREVRRQAFLGGSAHTFFATAA